MRIRFLNMVLLAALALAISRLWLFLGEPPQALPVADGEAPASASEATGGEKAPESAPLGPGIYDVVVARDLFSPTRGVVRSLPVAAPKPASKPLAAPKLTLYGVVIVDGEKAAFLQEGTSESRPRKVREHESFAGGTVSAIRPDGVTFLFNGSEINVLLRTPKVGLGPGMPRVQAPSGASPRPESPMAFPRRRLSPGAQPGMMPIPVGAGAIVPEMPSAPSPMGEGDDVFGVEEFPEGQMPGSEEPGMAEGEVEE